MVLTKKGRKQMSKEQMVKKATDLLRKAIGELPASPFFDTYHEQISQIIDDLQAEYCRLNKQ